MLPPHLAYGCLAKPPPPPPLSAPCSSTWQASGPAPREQREQRTLSKAPPSPPPGWARFKRGPQPPGDFSGPPIGEGRHIYGTTFKPPPPPPKALPPLPPPNHPPPVQSMSQVQQVQRSSAVTLRPAQPASSSQHGLISGTPGALGPPAGQPGPPLGRAEPSPEPPPRKRKRKRSPPRPFKGGTHVVSQTWRDSRSKAEQASPVHSRRTSRRSRARSQSQVLQSKSPGKDLPKEQAPPPRSERPKKSRTKPEAAVGRQRKCARHDASDSEPSPQPAARPRPPTPRRRGSPPPHVPPTSHSVSASPSHDGVPTEFEASLADWHRRRKLEEEVCKAESLAARRRAVDPGLRPGEIRSHCCQRASPRRPKRAREAER